jgi:hypothetical protein
VRVRTGGRKEREEKRREKRKGKRKRRKEGEKEERKIGLQGIIFISFMVCLV